MGLREAERIQICIPHGDTEADCLACEVGKEFIKSVVRSELYEKAAEIRIPLWSQATISESAKLQLEAYDGNEKLLIKSELVDYVLSPSADGMQVSTDLKGNSLAATVASNTAEIKELKEFVENSLGEIETLIDESGVLE